MSRHILERNSLAVVDGVLRVTILKYLPESDEYAVNVTVGFSMNVPAERVVGLA